MRVAAIQHDIAWEDPGSTFDIVRPMIASAAADGAELIVLTEMFATGFSMEASQVAESLDGSAAAFLAEQASLHGVTMVGSIPTRHPSYELPVNMLRVTEPDGAFHHYTKIHPFSFAGEDEHYSAGSEFLTVPIGGVRCTFFVCYDLRFADEFWATAADTDAYVVVANWPAARRAHWDTLLRARAIENQAYVVAANRVGVDGNDVEYDGGSVVIDPFGEVLGERSDDAGVVAADVSAERVSEIRARYPFAADRR